jgi:hypothetical protein
MTEEALEAVWRETGPDFWKGGEREKTISSKETSRTAKHHSEGAINGRAV